MRIALIAGALVAAAALAHGGASTPAAAPATDLRITLWTGGRPGPAQTWTLTCRPTGGTHPLRARACQRLAGLDRPFRPVPEDMLCTQVYGGPQEALVTGRHQGQRVWARFHLRDGCQISRWNRLRPLLPAGGPV